jgi:hypothetical protein
MYLVYLLLVPFVFQDLPFKPKDEFEVKLDYQFKQRPPVSHTSVKIDYALSDEEKRNSSAILPYLTLNVRVMKNAGATRVSIKNNRDQRLLNKKLKVEPAIIPLVLGYTDDVKDRVTAHEYTLIFMTDDKQPISKIVIFIDEDGTFLLNGEKRGRF